MIIALPPSEGKSEPATPMTVVAADLAFANLAPARSVIAHALTELGADDEAATLLKVGPRARADLAWNTDLTEGAPAREIYTGVLYEAARLREKDAGVWIFSGLYGVVRPDDVIAPYRLPADARLPELGPVATWWKPRLADTLNRAAAHERILIDCRSGPYQRMWTPPESIERIAVTVERRDGDRRRVVSHRAKHYRGLLTRMLLDGGPVDDVGDVLRVADDLPGVDAELTDTKDGARLTLVVDA
ncbi:MAG: peroxide stress protein YaaA [Bowdeniella nasicola]|nr:peroxide stress protein YaaA [Bowdeniella nasicola]